MRILGARGGTFMKVVAFTGMSFVLTVILAIRIGNLQLFRGTYLVEAEFANASGVFPGDVVKLAGVDVGRVKETHIEDGRAVVAFEVDDQIPVTTATRVGIRWRNVLGLRFIYLYPGEGGTPLEDGARIPISRTETAGDIGELLNNLGPILQAIDPDKANAFLEAMNTALAGNQAVVGSLLSRGGLLATDLAQADEQIQSLIRSSDRILGAYASQDRELGSIIDDLDLIGGALAGMTDDINRLIVNFAIVEEELDSLQKDSRADIDAGLAHLAAVAGTLARNREALERTLCSLPTGVAPYFQTTSWGEWFNVRIIEIVVKDNEGNVIASQREGQENRDGQAPPVVECPDGRPVRVFYDETGTTGSRTAPPQPSLDSWIAAVTGAS